MADARLEVTDALGRRIIPIAKTPFEIGRRETNDLRLAGGEISRDHAEITRDGDCFTLRDRSSRFGTYVNGDQITERVLVHGDRVRFGRSNGAEIVFLLVDMQTASPSSEDSDVAGVAVVVERRLNDEEYYYAIAAALERDTVHCPNIDSATLHRELQDPHSLAFRFLHEGFHRVVEFDARCGSDARGHFDLTGFLAHISRQMSDAFGLRLPQDEFHPEEISQMLKDEQRSLFCLLNVDVIPADQLRGLRGFGQEHHRMLLCGPHSLDGVKAKSVDRVERHTEIRDSGQLSAVLEGLRALESGRVLDDVLALVLDSAIELSGAERGFIMLALETGELQVRMARGRGHLTLSGGSFATSRKIPYEVLRTGQSRMVDNLRAGDLANFHLETVALGIRNVLCMPLRLVRYVDKVDNVRDEPCIGVLYLDSKERGPFVSPSIRVALETVATEAAIAIENARLYRETMEKAKMDQQMLTAAEVQQAMFRKALPARGFLHAAAASLPCRVISGDFYDYIEISGGSLAFALGDVAGTGPAAAMLSAMMLGMLAIQSTGTHSPSQTLERINLALYQRGIESRFVTMVYAILRSTGEMVYCNAGHTPVLLIGAAGVRRLECGGPIVGLFDSATYEEEGFMLSAGDWVVLFSDGMSEALSAAGDEYGEARIIDCVQRNRSLDPSQLLEALFKDVREFTKGVMQSDDITAMVLRYG